MTDFPAEVFVVNRVVDTRDGDVDFLEVVAPTQEDALDYLFRTIAAYRNEMEEHYAKVGNLAMRDIRWVVYTDARTSYAYLVWASTGGHLGHLFRTDKVNLYRKRV